MVTAPDHLRDQLRGLKKTKSGETNIEASGHLGIWVCLRDLDGCQTRFVVSVVCDESKGPDLCAEREMR